MIVAAVACLAGGDARSEGAGQVARGAARRADGGGVRGAQAARRRAARAAHEADAASRASTRAAVKQLRTLPGPAAPSPSREATSAPRSGDGRRRRRWRRGPEPVARRHPSWRRSPGASRSRASRGGPIYVYVENVKESPVDRSVEILQKDRSFVPNVLVVQRGTRVSFPNADPFLHNVFSPSPTQPFDLGSYRQGEKAGAVRLFKPGVVEVLCNMHAKMRANVLVVPNHHHVKVSADGSFRLENVPVGARQVVAWTPDARPVTESVTLTAAGANVKFALQVGPPPPPIDKDGQAAVGVSTGRVRANRVNTGASARSGVVLVVAGLAALAGTGVLVRQRAAADAAARQQAADVARAIEDSVSRLKAELGQELERAADIPQLRSALGNRADAVTFQDLFQHEDWWDAYRNRAAAIVVEDEVVVTQGLDPVGRRRRRAPRARHAGNLAARARIGRRRPSGGHRQPSAAAHRHHVHAAHRPPVRSGVAGPAGDRLRRRAGAVGRPPRPDVGGRRRAGRVRQHPRRPRGGGVVRARRRRLDRRRRSRRRQAVGAGPRAPVGGDAAAGGDGGLWARRSGSGPGRRGPAVSPPAEPLGGRPG